MNTHRGARLQLLALVAGGLLWTASPIGAETMTGEVIDLSCYMPRPENRGAGHRKCAETCFSSGLPMGILADDKRVYLLLEHPHKPKPYAALKKKAAENVTIEGKKVVEGGVQGIVVETVR